MFTMKLFIEKLKDKLRDRLLKDHPKKTVAGVLTIVVVTYNVFLQPYLVTKGVDLPVIGLDVITELLE